MRPSPAMLRGLTFALAAVGLALLLAASRAADPRPWLRGALLALGASQLASGWRLELVGQRRVAWLHVAAGIVLVLLGVRP